MRGDPLIRLIATLIAFLLLGVPVWELTRPSKVAGSSAMVSSPDAATQKVTLHLSFDYEDAPTALSLQVGDNASNHFVLSPGQKDGEWDVALPRESVDLPITATWPDNRRHALRVKIFGEGYHQIVQTFWSDGPLRDVITLTAQK